MTAEELRAEIERVARELRPHVEDIALRYWGPPAARSQGQWRWCGDGKRVLNIAGPRIGRWHDFSAGTGGDCFDLLVAELGDRDRAIEEARRWVGGDDHQPRPRPHLVARPAPPVAAPTANDTRRVALVIWGETRSAPGTAVDYYLSGRGICLAIPPALRFHPRLWHAASQRHWPAMVAKVVDVNGQFLGMHRIWLSDDWAPVSTGKAPVTPTKMTLGPIKGGAARLAPAGRRLIIGEGIESTLSAMQLSGGWPGWSGLSTSGLINLALPDCVRDVLVAADNDANGAGVKAATQAAERWRAEGRHVTIEQPPIADTDFNDAIRAVA